MKKLYTGIKCEIVRSVTDVITSSNGDNRIDDNLYLNGVEEKGDLK